MRFLILRYSVILLCCLQMQLGYSQDREFQDDHYNDGPVECGYTQEMNAADWQRTTAFRNMIIKKRNIKAGTNPVLSWPLQPSSDVYAPGYYITSNQVDLDPSPGILDYAGGGRTYNGHSGVDIRIWPYFWTLMDANAVEVIAAEAGTIVNKVDGNFDRNCTLSPGTVSNRIDILHDCGFTTFYLHLKSGSLTTKGVGDFVQRGEFLGLVGSSGNSTNPHLHFQVNDILGNPIEPYSGVFNPGPSLWDVQRPYLESSIVDLMTHNATPSLNNCSAPNVNTTDTPNERNHFTTGGNITFGSYYMAPLSGQSAISSVFDPAGNLQWIWATNINQTNPRNGQFFQSFVIPLNAIPGTWTYTVSFNNNTTVQVEEHHFTVACQNDLILSNINHTDGDGYIFANSITSTANIVNGVDRVLYESGGFIELKAGFVAESGASFRTRLDACTINGQ